MPRIHHRTRARVLLAVPLVALATVALVACGADSTSSSGTTTTAATKSTTTKPSGAGGAAAVSLAETDLGKVLVDAQGRTLYAFTPDTETKSNCNGGCAQAWPPTVASGTPTAGEGVTAELTVITRDDGTKQVAASGHPVYQYAGDTAAGETTGQGSGGTWYVLSADGSLVKSAAGGGSSSSTVPSSKSSTSTTSGSDYGY